MIARPPTTNTAASWLVEHAGADVDAMTGRQFEWCLAVMFTRLDYEVELTETYDFGADLIVIRDGVRSAVQAKRQEKKLGQHAVQQAVTGRAYYECHTASVVTTAEVQPRVRALAGKTGVSILDRQHLTRMLQMAGIVSSPQLLPAPQCSRCRTPLVARSGRHGPFWGCANYPRGCRVSAQYRYSLIIARRSEARPELTIVKPEFEPDSKVVIVPWHPGESTRADTGFTSREPNIQAIPAARAVGGRLRHGAAVTAVVFGWMCLLGLALGWRTQPGGMAAQLPNYVYGFLLFGIPTFWGTGRLRQARKK